MDALRVRLLGPVQLHVGGRPVPLGGPRRRALLAHLVVHRTAPVTAERLIDDLWGSPADPGARHSLQTNISALRRLLGGPANPRPITHGAQGYRLSVDGLSVDVDAFERAADRADRHHDPIEAARALELWGGEPLADLPPGAWSEGLVAAWQALHHRAALIHTEALLSHGHHERALALVDELLAGCPYDERLWAQRLHGLYLAGRQTEALAAYDRLHRQLRDELGIEPGPELVDLQGRILRHDRRLVGPAPPPHAVPATISRFVGRVSELDHLGQLIRDHRLVTITGPGGVGKTRTAVELAHAHRGRLPDGVFFVDLAAVDDGERVATEIAERMALGSRGAHGPDRLGASPSDGLGASPSDRRALLVIDNAEHLRRHVACAVVDLLREAGALRIVVTSRVALGVTGEVTWQLPPLDLPRAGDPPERSMARDAVQLFVHRRRELHPGVEVTDDELATVAAICRRLDGLPLAIEIAAGRLRVLTLRELASRLDHDLGGLGSSDPTVPERHRTLAGLLRWSTDPLDPVTRRILTCLAVVPGDFERDLAAAVCGHVLRDERRVGGDGGDRGPGLDAHLELLVEHCLVAVDTSGGRARHRLLEVVRDHARTLGDVPDDAQRAERALLDWALELTRLASRGLTGPEEPGWVERLASVRPALRAALAAGLAHHPAGGLRLATRLARFWWANAGDVDDRWTDELPTLHEGIHWLRRLLAAHDGDPRDRAGAQTALGFLLDVTGSHTEGRTLLLEVRDRMEAAGDLRLAGWATLYAANASWDRDPQEVITAYRRAGDRLVSGGDRWGQRLVVLLEYSYTLDHVGVDAARPALDRFLALTDGPSLPVTLRTYRAAVQATDAIGRGRPQEACAPLRTAIDHARRSTDPVTTSLLLAVCGWYAAAVGDVPSASRWLAAAEMTERRHGLELFCAEAGRRRVEVTLGAALTPAVRTSGRREAASLPVAAILDQARSALAGPG